MRFIAALLTCFATWSHATAVTADYTDLWYNPNESGWGANVAQQGDTLFITLFVYGTNGQPTWYVASDVRYQGNQGAPSNTFTGQLFQTSGPYFGASSFNPAGVTHVRVGDITFSASAVSAASLTYTVNGVSVSKPVIRQTWKAEALSGTYVGASIGVWSACGASRNGSFEAPVTLTVTHDGAAVTMREDGPSYTCTYTGTYSQGGRMGQIVGNGLCTDGINQSINVTEVQVGVHALTMRMAANQFGGCNFVGRMGGVRR
jgi:hypothetical protein